MSTIFWCNFVITTEILGTRIWHLSCFLYDECHVLMGFFYAIMLIRVYTSIKASKRQTRCEARPQSPGSLPHHTSPHLTTPHHTSSRQGLRLPGYRKAVLEMWLHFKQDFCLVREFLFIRGKGWTSCLYIGCSRVVHFRVLPSALSGVTTRPPACCDAFWLFVTGHNDGPLDVKYQRPSLIGYS